MNKPLWAAMIVCSLSLTSDIVVAKDDDRNFFQSKIAPLLKTHCLECHSHASKTMESGLALDSRSGWAVGGDNGPAIVPGNPDQSLLIQAVRHSNPELQMPPEKKLSDADVDLLVQWVRRGAPDPRQMPIDHVQDTWWSLKTLTRQKIPRSSASLTADHPIDAFVQTKLAAAGIAMGQQADRRTLIRRLYYDLHGLMPSPEQVQAFVTDPDPLAYEKLVDRLLDSPRYGERWARHWLDAIHFADSHGCEHDYKRPHAWRFRDYVVNRLNLDIPWDRFIREQLAADEFYPDQPELTAALGFIAAGPLELSRAGTAPVTFDYLDRDDMVTQTMASFASTTANCARCHTHKFDPITQEDYYALQAVFAGVGKGDVEYDTSKQVAIQRQHFASLIAAAKVKDPDKLLNSSLRSVVDQWEQQYANQPNHWEPLAAEVFLSTAGATLTRGQDGSFVVSGQRPDQDTYTVTASLSQTRLTAIRLDVLADESLPKHGPGRADNGNLHLTEFEAQLFAPGADQAVPLKFQTATADWNQDGWTIVHALDGNLKTAWGIYPKVGESHHAVFALEKPFPLAPGTRLVVSLRQLHGGHHLIGRFRLYATDAEPSAARVLPAEVVSALKIPAAERSPDQQLEIAAQAVVQHCRQQLAALPAKATVYAVSPSWSRGKKLDSPEPPKVVHLLRRGDISKPIREVVPGAVAAVSSLAGRFSAADCNIESKRRAALADWLASPENPLTWRSVVNRVWHYHFGRGICDTPNDLGRMGGSPSNVQLLDWLAVWFRDDARGSLKKLHRLIVTSATWQQATASNPRALQIDSDNRLLWRANRRRLDAETFRDQALQLSGRLDLRMGGPGVEQFSAAEGIQNTPFLDYGGFDWNSPAAKRRSLYRVVWRGIPDPFMEAMDFPDLGLLSAKREFSASPLQSLTLYNDNFVLQTSQWFADRLEHEEQTMEDRVRRAALLTFLREPTTDELRDLSSYANSHGLAALCRVLLNSNEFLFVD